MLEPAVLVLRFVQYGGIAVLFGTSLFFLYALPKDGAEAAGAARWPSAVLAMGALLLFAGTLLGLVAQTGVMAGSLQAALEPSAMAAVAGMGLGRAALVRAVAAGLALAAVALARPGRGLWTITTALGALAAVSAAWMGHAAGAEGPARMVHLGADILHILAASAWVGALVAFLLLLRSPSAGGAATHRALHGFAGVGSGAVAVLIATGTVNSWFLVGPSNIDGLWTTGYGLLLSAKLALFGGMLLLAASNRFRLTPEFGARLKSGADASAVVRALRRSLLLETLAGFAVLAAVAWLGGLTPVTSD